VIRSVGRLGPLRVAGLVLWQLRFTLLAIIVAVGVLIPVPDASQSEYAAAVLSVLGIGASVFIAFRNTTAYNRWWEARTLWGSIIIGARTLNYGLTAVDDGSPAMAEILDRMRRRQVRYCWQLAAELRRIPPVAGATDLTPEDPADADAVELLNRRPTPMPRLLRVVWSGSATSLCPCTMTCSSEGWRGSSGSWHSAASTAPPTTPSAW